MIRFNARVCHPHWCVLVIMETLRLGMGRGDAMREGGRTRCKGNGNGANYNVDNNKDKKEGGGTAAGRKDNADAMIDAGCSIPFRARALYSGCFGY
jgi:hypothetical protein